MSHISTPEVPQDPFDQPVFLKSLTKEESAAMIIDLKELELDCWDRGEQYSDLGLFVTHSLRTISTYRSEYELSQMRHQQL